MSKQTAEIIIRHLLGIVAALRKEYAIPASHEIAISQDDTMAGFVNSDKIAKTTE